MERNEKITAFLGLLAITAITLATSVEHHRIIAGRYGNIANVFVPILSVSTFALGSFISLLFQWGINVIHFEQIVKLLPANERIVMTLLFNKRVISQADLSAQTGLPRVAVSRAVSSLEGKGVIVKRPLDNTNIIESSVYRVHPSTQVLARLPGLSERRLMVAISLLFIFGISLSILNSFHILTLGHPLEPALYLLTTEFLALGGIATILLRRRVASSQFDRILRLLQEDEQKLLRVVYADKSITQNDLVGKTGVYKMKVSRILAKFEQNGIIEKKPHGYTNMVISRI